MRSELVAAYNKMKASQSRKKRKETSAVRVFSNVNGKIELQQFVGKTGAVWSVGGQVAGCFPDPPSLGLPGTIRFKVTGAVDDGEAGPNTPAWVDLSVEGEPVRITGELFKNGIQGLFRLYDCVVVAHKMRDKIMKLKPLQEWMPIELPPMPHPNSERFLFGWERLINADVIFVDTEKRAMAFRE